MSKLLIAGEKLKSLLSTKFFKKVGASICRIYEQERVIIYACQCER